MKRKNSRQHQEQRDYYLIPDQDMYQCFLGLVKAGRFSYHPHRWLLRSVSSSFLGRVEDELHIKNSVLIDGFLSGEALLRGASWGKARRNISGHYICDAELMAEYCKNMQALSIDEAAIQDTVEALLPEYTIEVRAGDKIGKIDLISSSAIVEIKKFLDWKQGLGQILAYAYAHPEKQKILLLYKKKINAKQLSEAHSICAYYGVHLETIEDGTCANQWLQRTKLRFN